MKVLRLLVSLSSAACLTVSAGLVSGGAAAAQPTPTLVALRAAHHPGYDRIVYEFRGGPPPRPSVQYVDRLVGDASGLPVPIAGRAILRVRLAPATAHDPAGPTVPGRRAFALPNIMTNVQAGDFEGVTTYGIGLARRTRFHVFTLRSPSRVVIDVRAAFPTVARKVYFFNRKSFENNNGPYVSPRLRPVRPLTPAGGVMDRLMAGPVPGEAADGLALVASHATGFTGLTITDGVARVKLTGGCSSDGSTVTIADEIMPTLRQFASVHWVKIYGPDGSTERPTGHTDSIPTCLEP